MFGRVFNAILKEKQNIKQKNAKMAGVVNTILKKTKR